MSSIDLTPQLDEIMAADLSEIDKLSKAFLYLISQHIEISRREIELLKTLDDMEGVVKEQIKANTMEYTLGMFRHLHMQATGRKVLDE